MPAVANEGTAKGSPGLLVIGAGLLVANWIVLGLLAGEWNPGAFYIALALMVLLSSYNVGGISLNARTLRAIGLFVGLAALVIVLADLRFDGFPSEGVRWIAYVVFVAGAALMFWGARSLSD
jgi:hypothetical protein